MLHSSKVQKDHEIDKNLQITSPNVQLASAPLIDIKVNYFHQYALILTCCGENLAKKFAIDFLRDEVKIIISIVAWYNIIILAACSIL